MTANFPKTIGFYCILGKSEDLNFPQNYTFLPYFGEILKLKYLQKLCLCDYLHFYQP